MSTARTAVRASLLASLAIAAVVASSQPAGAVPLRPNLVASTSSTPGYYTVKNNSSVKVGAFKIRVTYEYASSFSYANVSGLGAYQSVTLPVDSACGSYTIAADYQFVIVETSESDNGAYVYKATGCS